MRTLLNVMCFIAALLITMVATYAFAGDAIQACTLADGSILYTNKPVQGCMVLKMPELSIVPSYHVQNGGASEHTWAFLPEVPLVNPVVETEESEVVTKTCALYYEWVNINQRTKGGFEYNNVDDTKERLYLTKIFGSGFSPGMCKLH